MSLFSTLLPVLMRQGNFSLSTIGLLQLIKLPWILKVFWAPFVDKRTSDLGSYKSWPSSPLNGTCTNQLMGVFHGTRAVQQGKQHEHHGLDHGHQHAEAQNRQRGKERSGQHEEHAQQNLFGKDVAEKTHGE